MDAEMLVPTAVLVDVTDVMDAEMLVHIAAPVGVTETATVAAMVAAMADAVRVQGPAQDTVITLAPVQQS